MAPKGCALYYINNFNKVKHAITKRLLLQLINTKTEIF